MRDIKFRQPTFIQWKFDGFHYWWFIDNAFYWPLTWRHLSVSQQFTWLLDKNGKEIYEGDIAKIAVNPYHWTFEVKFWRYKLREQKKHQIERPANGWYLERWLEILSLMHAVEQDTSYFSSTHSVEVIWNIYENPELLK